MMKFKSDKQVKAHLGKSPSEAHKAMTHEKKESMGFEKAEHRIGGKNYGFGKKKGK